MNDLSAFAVTSRWPASHPDRLQLYSLPTPNGVKVSIMLEEIGLPYEVHRVSFDDEDQLTPEFLSVSPNNKIPAILDPDGPGGKPLALFESGAILSYLAEKTGLLVPADPAGRYETLQWLMFQMGGVGPMFGQLGFFHKFAGREYEDKRPRDRYVTEAERLLGVLDRRLSDRAWITGDDYGIADIATFPWVRNLVGFYGGRTCRLRTVRQRPASARRLRRPTGRAARIADPACAGTGGRIDRSVARHALDRCSLQRPMCASAQTSRRRDARLRHRSFFEQCTERPIMQHSTEAFIAAERAGHTWERRPPRPEDDHLLGHTHNWLAALPKGVRPVHLPVLFPRLVNELCGLWLETAALDDYFEEKEFSPRDDRRGFPALIKEELLALHLYALRNRGRRQRTRAQQRSAEIGP